MSACSPWKYLLNATRQMTQRKSVSEEPGINKKKTATWSRHEQLVQEVALTHEGSG